MDDTPNRRTREERQQRARLCVLASEMKSQRAHPLRWGAGAALVHGAPKLASRCELLADLIFEADQLRRARAWNPNYNFSPLSDADREYVHQLLDQLVRDRGVAVASRLGREGHNGEQRRTRVRSSEYLRVALEAEYDMVAKAVTERNNTLVRASFNIGQLVGAGLLMETDATDVLVDAAHECGLNEREARATIRSGLRAGTARPRVLRRG